MSTRPSQPRRPGYIYLPLDVEFMEDDRIADVGEKAAWLYLGMCLRSKQLVSDGKLTARHIERLPMTGTTTRLRALIKAGLVVEDAGQYVITAWRTYNATSTELQDAAEKRLAGAALGNHRRWHEERGVIDPTCDHCVDRSTDRSSDRSTDRLPIATESVDRSMERSPSDSLSESTEREGEREGEREAEGVHAHRLTAVPNPPAPPVKGTRIPQDFPDPKDRDSLTKWAREHAPAVAVSSETANWQDWHRAKGDTAKDWNASWRTWMRRAQKDAERSRPTAGHRTSAADSAVAQALAVADRYRQAELTSGEPA